MSEPTTIPDDACTSHLEVQAIPRLTSQSENCKSDVYDDVEVGKRQDQFNSALEYATALTSWGKCIFVARLLASIETESREFELLRSEIWTAFFWKYRDCDTALEKTRLFGEQFFAASVDTFDELAAADVMVRMAGNDEGLCSFLNRVVESSGSRRNAIELLKLMRLVLSDDPNR